MIRVMSAMLVALGVAGLVTAAEARDDGKIGLSRIPAAARKAAEKAVPGFRIAEAYRDEDEGKTVYELSGEDAQGRDVEVVVTPQGRVLEVGVEIPLASVPRVVSKALRARMKGFRPTSAMEVHEAGGVTSYSFEGTDAQGREIEVSVSADGRDVEIEDDDA